MLQFPGGLDTNKVPRTKHKGARKGPFFLKKAINFITIYPETKGKISTKQRKTPRRNGREVKTLSPGGGNEGSITLSQIK